MQARPQPLYHGDGEGVIDQGAQARVIRHVHVKHVVAEQIQERRRGRQRGLFRGRERVAKVLYKAPVIAQHVQAVIVTSDVPGRDAVTIGVGVRGRVLAQPGVGGIGIGLEGRAEERHGRH